MNVVLLSGGWDSALCLLEAHQAQVAMFCHYGQPYWQQERHASLWQAEKFQVPWVERYMKAIRSDAGIFERRNELLLLEAKALGAKVVWFGARNPFAWLDKYGDSNRSWVQTQRQRLGLDIRTPCMCLPKAYIKWRVQRAGIPAERVFSTEGLS